MDDHDEKEDLDDDNNEEEEVDDDDNEVEVDDNNNNEEEGEDNDNNEEEDNDNDNNKEEEDDNNNNLLLDLLTRCLGFAGFVGDFFWICRRNLLDLSTKSFGFVDKIFWICRRNLLNLLEKYANDRIVTWVTRPERPKGAKDEVKEARRAAN